MLDFTWGEDHVEQPTRLINIFDELDKINNINWQILESNKASDDEVSLVHDCKFISNLKESNEKALEASYYACGAVFELVKKAIKGEIKAGFAIIRPAGHHSSTFAKGSFCGINSIMVAAFSASAKNMRVLILDIDAHFAGGSEEILLNLKNSELAKNIYLIDIYISLYDKKMGEKAKLAKYDIILLQDYVDSDSFIDLLEYPLKNAEIFNPEIILVNSGYD